jgi:hypothetical protein
VFVSGQCVCVCVCVSGQCVCRGLFPPVLYICPGDG